MKWIRITTTRRFQIAFSVLLLVCAAQIAYWVIDEVRFSVRVGEHKLAEAGLHAEVATVLAGRGFEAERITKWFPDLERAAAGKDGYQISRAFTASVERERSGRINRFLWEGAFFLAVLVAGVIVIARALRQTAELRHHQENFLAAVSHELKSPLASIRLSAETLALRDPPDRARWMRRLQNDVDRLEKMIQNILDARRVDEPSLQSSPEPTELLEVVQQVVHDSELHPTLEGRSIHLDIEPDLTVFADPSAVRAVLANLVDNSLKALQRMTRLDPSRRDLEPIQIEARREGDEVHVIVADHGDGFDPAETEKLFAKFYRAGEELRRQSPGVGLGLYLVKRWVELDSGRVSGESGGIGQGATFHVHWPAAPSVVQPSTGTAHPVATGKNG